MNPGQHTKPSNAAFVSSPSAVEPPAREAAPAAAPTGVDGVPWSTWALAALPITAGAIGATVRFVMLGRARSRAESRQRWVAAGVVGAVALAGLAWRSRARTREAVDYDDENDTPLFV